MIALREQTGAVEYALDAPLLDVTKYTGSFVVPVRRGHTTESDICSAMQGFSPQDVSCLFMTGGDTATLVCRALGIQSLQLRDEFEPGLPRGVAAGGAFAGCTVILKSGGFGETDVLCRIARTFQPTFQTRIEDAP
jgi:uncharacterized protein YgbK (DUF1537 family)